MKRRILAVAILLAAMIAVVSVIHAPQAQAQQYATCNSAAAAPACQSTSNGNVSIAAAAQTVVVSTTAVQSNNVIIVSYDQSLGTDLSVTCNTTAQQPYVSARVPGVSFTIKTASTFTTNPGCVNFHILSSN